MSAEWEMSRITLIRARSRATWQRIKRVRCSQKLQRSYNAGKGGRAAGRG